MVAFDTNTASTATLTVKINVRTCLNYFSVKDIEDISLVLGSVPQDFELPLFFDQTVASSSDINADCGTPTVDLIENPTQSVSYVQPFTSSIASITTTEDALTELFNSVRLTVDPTAVG